MTMNVIETRNLTKIFDRKHIAVNNVNLSVEKRAIFGFLGPNGAGKTTTIRLLLGLIKPSAGNVKILGENMTFNSSLLRGRIGYLPTNPRFPPKMTAISYLDFVGKIFGLSREARTSRLSRLIRAADLLSDSSKEIRSYSTGMTTRLGIAAALMNDPELLILDEPTAGLDPTGRKSTMDLIRKLGEEKTVFISSHILSDIDRICTHVGVINQGKVIFTGPIKDMKKIIRNNSIQMELDGKVDAFCGQLERIEGVESFERRGDFWLQINLNLEKPLPEVIANLMQLIGESGVELISINTASTKIEDAFIKLLEEEETYGFLRAVTA